MKIKRILAIALSVTTITASSMVAFASGSASASGPAPAPTTTTTTTTVETILGVPEVTIPTTSKVMVGGKEVKSTLVGSYASTVPAAVTTPAAEISAAMGLKGDQKPYLIVMDTDQKKSYLAMNSLNGAAAALNVKMGPVINFNLGIREGAYFTTLAKNSAVTVSYTMSIPADFAGASSYSVIGVYAGGELAVYQDLDKDPTTITVKLPAGLGCYALVSK